MSKYCKVEDIMEIFSDESRPENWMGTDAEIQEQVDFDFYKSQIESLPTIEVSEDNQVLYGTDHNCILTMFGECSYNETGCGDCAVAEKIRKALRAEVSEDCIRREYLKSFEYINKGDFNSVETIREWIDNAPSVVPKDHSGESTEMVGRWQITDAYPHNVYCSDCHKKFAQTHWAVWEDGSLPRNYCPNCGARMEG